MDNIIYYITIPIAIYLVGFGIAKLLSIWSPKGPGFKFFRIKAGKHRARPMFYPTFRKKDFRVEFEIDESCHYNHPDYSIQDVTQINKIYGLSYCILPRIRIREGKIKFYSPHHWNSSRVGFSSGPNNDFFIYSYGYNKGVRTEDFCTIVNPNEKTRVSSDWLISGHNRKSLFGYHLWPFVGGLNPAKRDCLIKVKVIE